MSFLKASIQQTGQFSLKAAEKSAEANEVKIVTGSENDMVLARGDYNQVLSESGDDMVMLQGDFNDVFAYDGNKQIGVSGNVNYISTENGDSNIYMQGNYNSLQSRMGNQYVESHGDVNLIDLSHGNHQIFSTGYANGMYFGNGNTTVNFWGAYNVIAGGNGNHNISTLDYLIQENPDSPYAAYSGLIDQSANVLPQPGGSVVYDFAHMNNAISLGVGTQNIRYTGSLPVFEGSGSWDSASMILQRDAIQMNFGD